MNILYQVIPLPESNIYEFKAGTGAQLDVSTGGSLIAAFSHLVPNCRRFGDRKEKDSVAKSDLRILNSLNKSDYDGPVSLDDVGKLLTIGGGINVVIAVVKLPDGPLTGKVFGTSVHIFSHESIKPGAGIISMVYQSGNYYPFRFNQYVWDYRIYVYALIESFGEAYANTPYLGYYIDLFDYTL